jgi:hypothetical protein
MYLVDIYFAAPRTLQFDCSMPLAFFLLSRFMRDGITVDDLALLLAVVAVIILFKGHISHVAVGPLI